LARRHGDFGPVKRLAADAVGRPGQRAFRVLIQSEQGTACLWVERGQLEALAMLIEQLLTGLPATQVRGGPATGPDRSAANEGFPAQPDVEFRVGQLALGFEERTSLYVLLAHSVDSDAGEEADFTCLTTRSQLRELSEGIPTLLAAGRPRCPTCEQPLGPGQHRCARANGHVRGVES
jgi:uncharacterized repeat protein (TIGR03847 family)